MEKQEKFIKMTTEPIPKLIAGLALPSIISMLVTTIYNTADTFFISKISTSATGAVGISFAFMAVLQAIGFFFGHGGGNYISRKLGSKELEAARLMATTSLVLAFSLGLVVAVLGVSFAPQLALFLGSTPTILPYAQTYLGLIALGSPVIVASFVLNNQLRFQGNAVYGMVGILSGALLNLLLDPLLIFYFELGIAGAAIATVFSQLVGFTILFMMTRRGDNLPLRWCYFAPSWGRLKEIVMGGSPSLFRQGMESVSIIMLNLAAGVFGDAAIAAMSIVTRVTFLLTALLIGFGQGFQPVCGFNYGAGLYQRVREGFYFCVKTGFLVLAVLSALGGYWAPEIISVFRDDPAVISAGIDALRWQLLTLPCVSVIILANMTLQTCRQPVGAVLVALARRGLFLIPYLFIFPVHFGLPGLFWCQPLADISGLLLSVVSLHYFFSHLPQQQVVESVGQE